MPHTHTLFFVLAHAIHSITEIHEIQNIPSGGDVHRMPQCMRAEGETGSMVPVHPATGDAGDVYTI